MRLVAFFGTFLVLLLTSACSAQPDGAQNNHPAVSDSGETARLAFRNAQNKPPADWDGPTFKLSHVYPADAGTCDPKVCKWLGMNIESDLSGGPDGSPPTWDSTWNDYVDVLKDYVFQGQDPNLHNDNGFVVEVEGTTRWFHVPWMAYNDTSGRDFVHGTTNERTAHLADFIGDGRGFGLHTLPGVEGNSDCESAFPHGFETWSVGFYNEWGGQALGQAFSDGKPAIGSYLGSPMPEGLPFSPGTMVAKLLFTNAPVSCVPFLVGSPQWQVNRHKMNAKGEYQCEREVQVSRLVQMDVAVVDTRAPMRWVYTTFVYDGTSGGKTATDRLIALGAQWGSDPWSYPAVPDANKTALYQSVLNPAVNIPEHEGCGNRLAGPVDNPKSSCISCHASAYAATGGVPQIMGTNTPPSFGFPGICDEYSAQNANYFQNTVPPQGYAGGHYPNTISLDTSLQLAVAFDQYGNFNTNGRPQTCTNPDQF